jgi:hypothetical protein
MEQQRCEIECGRCGETRLEFLSEEERRVTSEGSERVYRPCERCRKVTGWSKTRSQRAAEIGPVMALRPMVAKRLVPRGQERMATTSERDEVNSLLHRSDRL